MEWGKEDREANGTVVRPNVEGGESETYIWEEESVTQHSGPIPITPAPFIFF